jgi:hypothetical protein
VASQVGDFMVDFPTWLQFVREIAYSLPDFLVFVLGFVRPRLFRQEAPDFELFFQTDVLSILIASLLCQSVRDHPLSNRVVSSVCLLLNVIEEFRWTDALETAFSEASPGDLEGFISIFPVVPNSLVFLESICCRFICKYLDEEFDPDLNFGVSEKLRALCHDTDSEELAGLTISLLMELMIIRTRKGDVDRQWFENQLSFFIRQPVGSAVALKEKLSICLRFIQIYGLSSEP